ncbi:rhomboid family intramembrane serine protease [Leucobacter sp. UT-8R-CII-1-4]|uniref:rhomboid family intramembrane serine protease n=1 Tax=Leucobacter sp. UT-8R-CII-1-4 TaxID=3040075 RepID=UPI0024A9EFC5|nr:rhomboid family intramembrane serine protease [Leucobacter sp. UT-8R-CII-1-4]MDI6023443.1 rhomboid family intramembrane serine protease [Leucobacter sp. UT-8R-CII-1-4]
MSFGGTGTPRFGERAEPGPNDYCYRHKDRPSFTLCQRCGRTICSECQIVSPVGVLCAECVRAAAPSTSARVGRSARVITRKLSDTDRPIVTYIFIALCAIVFVAQMISSWFFGRDGIDPVTATLWYAPVYSLPSDVSATLSSSFGFEPWRLFTAMFTHSTGFFLHILFNMYALWLFGPGLERLLGRLWFTVLYLFSGIGGSLGVMMWVYFAPNTSQALFTAAVGASGAIFGLLAATFVALKANRANVTSLAVLIGINFAIGLIPGAAISWQAHLGGMVIGALTMWLLLITNGPRKATQRVVAMSGVAVLIVALSMLYFVVLPG